MTVDELALVVADLTDQVQALAETVAHLATITSAVTAACPAAAKADAEYAGPPPG